nr:phage tail assembly protein [Moorena bouillonii]
MTNLTMMPEQATMLQTEYEFTLPAGYVDKQGNLHREGTMRLATAADEIVPLKDPRVQSNPAYLIVILLSRVVTRIGSVEMINPKVIEGLFASDLAYLQDLYNRINGNGMRSLQIICPHCEKDFAVELDMSGEY